ncbi:Dol-P-Man:Man(5)GlcNAc(2)-PP-Dol alpha-1,3-mannosyltransferase, partial [Trichoplax sp. H2]
CGSNACTNCSTGVPLKCPKLSIMPPFIKSHVKQPTQSIWTVNYFKHLLLDLLFNPRSIGKICLPLLLFEILLNIIVIFKVSYTEIDWEAYMSEVEGFLNGTYDYGQLKGATGPLVYPAGFVYIYSILYMVTRSGQDILLAQYIFAVLYLINLVLVMNIYRKTAIVPPYVLVIICCTSYRIHSIYILRMFNDPVAMLFLYAAINCFIFGYWTSGCVCFSLAVSIKMNILLFAPALLILLLLQYGIIAAIPRLAICAIIQIALAAPFLLNYPKAYLTRSFDFGRKFFFKWTVNWRFLSEDIFLNRWFHLSLLAAHLLVLIAFIFRRWLKKCGGYESLLRMRASMAYEPDSKNILCMII